MLFPLCVTLQIKWGARFMTTGLIKKRDGFRWKFVRSRSSSNAAIRSLNRFAKVIAYGNRNGPYMPAMGGDTASSRIIPTFLSMSNLFASMDL